MYVCKKQIFGPQWELGTVASESDAIKRLHIFPDDLQRSRTSFIIIVCTHTFKEQTAQRHFGNFSNTESNRQDQH
jgi:hypothetical protein